MAHAAAGVRLTHMDDRDAEDIPSMRGWRDLEFPHFFSVRVPPGSTHALSDDNRSVAIRLPTRPATEVLFGNYRIRAEDANVGRQALLRQGAETFVDESIRPQVGTGYPADIQIIRDGDWNVCRGVLLVRPRWLWRPADYWYFWMWALDDSDRICLLHWNGPEKFLHSMIIPIFCTFEPRI